MLNSNTIELNNKIQKSKEIPESIQAKIDKWKVK